MYSGRLRTYLHSNIDFILGKINLATEKHFAMRLRTGLKLKRVFLPLS